MLEGLGRHAAAFAGVHAVASCAAALASGDATAAVAVVCAAGAAHANSCGAVQGALGDGLESFACLLEEIIVGSNGFVAHL